MARAPPLRSVTAGRATGMTVRDEERRLLRPGRASSRGGGVPAG